MVKVSVIVPAYNSERYLPQCLDSLVTQKFEDFEIVCVNDGSTDSTLQILEEYSEAYSNIVILNNETNRGLSYSRNRGIREAEGEFLIFVDSDDWLVDENVISTLYKKAVSKKTDLLRFNISTDEKIVDDELYMDGRDLFVYLINKEMYEWEACRNFVRRDALIENNLFFEENIIGCEDMLFSTLCIWKITKVVQIPNKFYFYNRHEGSITTSGITTPIMRGWLRAINSLYSLFGEIISDSRRYFLLKFIDYLVSGCECLLFSMDEQLELANLPQEVLCLYDNIFKEGRLIHNYILHRNWDLLLSYSPIYIYGAGAACEELLRKTERKIHYSGIIVTDKTEYEARIHKLEVHEVSDSSLDKFGLVIICLKGRNRQREVKESLKKYGFENYLVIAKE